MKYYNKYLKYKNKYLNLKNKIKLKQTGGNSTYFGENMEDKKNNKITMYLFKAEWCGHCKNFKDTWNSVANQYSDNINFITYDSNKHQNKLQEWGVNSFPTISVRKGNEAFNYDGRRDSNSLIEYIKNLI